MGAKNQRAKGAANENAIRDLLTPWWHHVEAEVDGEPVVFARTPGSGGHHRSKEFDMAGDLMTNARLFPFAIEVKAREGWTFERFFHGFKSPVWGWWKQCVRDAEKTNRVPFLIFKKNRQPWMVLVPFDYISAIPGTKCPDIVFDESVSEDRELPVHPCMYLASNFLAHDPHLFAR